MLFLRLSYGHRSNQYHYFKEDLFHANRKQKRLSSKGLDRYSSVIFVRTCYLYSLCVSVFFSVHDVSGKPIVGTTRCYYLLSALIAWKTGCTNGKTLTISYIIYMILTAFSGTYIPFLFFSKQTLEQYAGMFGESYLGILQTLVSPVTAIIMLVVVAICAFIGALIAKKLLKKHFKKAGMV